MRDLDDVSANLTHVENAGAIQHTDVQQRAADLRFAGLVDTSDAQVKLTKLGSDVLTGWRFYKVDNADKRDELARTSILYGLARRSEVEPYSSYFAYWSELRSTFDAEELIDSWDTLYTLNYLDHRLGEFAPGDAYRDEGTPIGDIEFDLDLLAQSAGASRAAIKGAEQVRSGIEGKIPRARARATACLAMELLLRVPADRGILLNYFGVPKKPRDWELLDQDRVALVLNIVASFDEKARASSTRPFAGTAPLGSKADSGVASAFDYEGARQPAPQPEKVKQVGKRGGPKKIDHRRRQERNGEVGQLGEEFALGYERWRLVKHPKLAKQVVRVSLEDDTLGYDIHSFDTNGDNRHVEVKGTEGPLVTRFYLSSGEIAFAEQNPKTYVILRVGGLRTAPTYCEIRYPFKELDLRPVVYECTFRPKETSTQNGF